MPELPEVETVKRGLNNLVVGKTIYDVSFDWPKSFPNDLNEVESYMKSASVISVRRRAKLLIIDLSSRYSLVIHLKMTGQLVFVGIERFGAGHPNNSLIAKLPDRSTRVIIGFDDDSTLYFNDQRKFGWMKLIPTDMIVELEFMKKVGPEPLADSFGSKEFVERLKRRKNSCIKAVLLDQSVIAGVGNIYADESLWGAKINPADKVCDLSDKKLGKLFNELQYVLRLSIEKGGSTNKNYVDAEGKKGSYMDFARVFRREGLACPRCASIIIKSRVAGRGTHTCPNCQK